MKLSIVIPAQNEAAIIEHTVSELLLAVREAAIDCEVIIVDDGSRDGTGDSSRRLSEIFPEIRVVENRGRHGFGMAVRVGIDHAVGDAVAIMMADGSDSARDLITYYDKLGEGFDCVFGSRFVRGGSVVDYPAHKLILNRIANWAIRVLFGIALNDTTNAFKCYRRTVIEGIQPLISPHFNLTVEMPLKAIVRGYSYCIVPISWTNRKTGISKLKLREMGSRYLFIVLYLWLEKLLACGDYHRQNVAEHSRSISERHA